MVAVFYKPMFVLSLFTLLYAVYGVFLRGNERFEDIGLIMFKSIVRRFAAGKLSSDYNFIYTQ